jgi:hypothetical protein
LGCCNASGARSCTPGGPNTCPLGTACADSCVCAQNPTCSPSVATFNADGTVSSCPGALQCCQKFSQDAATCSGLQSASACNASAVCRWPGRCVQTQGLAAVLPCASLDAVHCQAASSQCTWQPAASATCQYRYATCCPPTSAGPRCFTDPETAANKVYCAPGSCSCSRADGTSICPQGQDCDPQNNCACFTNGG